MICGGCGEKVVGELIDCFLCREKLCRRCSNTHSCGSEHGIRLVALVFFFCLGHIFCQIPLGIKRVEVRSQQMASNQTEGGQYERNESVRDYDCSISTSDAIRVYAAMQNQTITQ